MGLILQGNFGMAMEWRRPVTEVIGDRLWLTMVVSLAAVIFTWALALPIGIYSAVRQYSFLDYVFTFLGFIGLAVPGFLLALLVMYFGFAYFGANIGGLFSPEYADAPWSLAQGRGPARSTCRSRRSSSASPAPPSSIRIMRANLLDELRKPYVVTARAKGLSGDPRRSCKYPVRVALNPVRQHDRLPLPYVVSGSIIVSLVLSLPTVGPLLLKALIAQDMFLAGTIVLLLGVMTVIGTLISDLLLMWIDPRIRLADGAMSAMSSPAVDRRRSTAGRASRRRGARRGRHPVAADVVALPQAPAGDGRRHRRDRCSTSSSLFADFLAYADPNASDAQRGADRAAADPLVRRRQLRARTSTRSSGKRDPLTFKRVYVPDPSTQDPAALLRARLRRTSCSASSRPTAT